MRKIILALSIISFAYSLFASAAASNEKGIEKFEEGNYEAALTDFRDAELDDSRSPIIGHNLGSTLYQQKRYDKSIEELAKSIHQYQAEDSVILSQLYYNLGNNYFRKDSLMQSIQMYKKALEYNPNDEDAKYNLELARALIKENSEKQNQQQNQQQQQQQQQQQDQKDQKDQQDQKEQEDQKDQEKEQQQQEKQQEEEQQQAKPKPKDQEDEMSKEEAKQLLKALEDKDREKKEEQRLPAGSPSGNNW